MKHPTTTNAMTMSTDTNFAQTPHYHGDWADQRYTPLEGQALEDAKRLQEKETALADAKARADQSSTYNEMLAERYERSRMTPAQRINEEIYNYERSRR